MFKAWTGPRKKCLRPPISPIQWGGFTYIAPRVAQALKFKNTYSIYLLVFLRRFVMRALRLATTILSVFILSSASIGLADGGDNLPLGGHGDNSAEADANAPCNPIFGFNQFCRAVKFLTGNKSESENPAQPVPTKASGDAPTASSSNRMNLSRMNRDGRCLTLDENQDYYPLFNLPNDQIEAITYVDKELPITFNISQESVVQLIEMRSSGINIQDWPMVLHGPLKLCGSVDFHFTAQSRDNSKPWTRLEVGPKVYIEGKNNNNVSIDSSQIRNIEIVGNCAPASKLNNFDRACIRFTNDLRMSTGHLFIIHEGRDTCRIDGLNISDVEKNSVGYSKRTPLRCDQISQISTERNYDRNVSISQPTQSVPVTTNGSVIVTGPVIRSSVTCDGTYSAPILPILVNPNYGLQNAPPATESAPAIAKEHKAAKKMKSKKVAAVPIAKK